MARKTIIDVNAEIALSEKTVFEVLRHLEIRCDIKGAPVTLVCPFGARKTKAAIVIYDHRQPSIMAAYRFENWANHDNAQWMVEKLTEPARVRVVTSRIEGVNRQAINFYPPDAKPKAFFVGAVGGCYTEPDENDPIPCLWEWRGKIPGRNVVGQLKICPT